MSDAPILKIVLMHGTWATKAKWPLETGRIQLRLKEKFGDKIEPMPLGWGGKNRNSHRQAGADSLARLIKENPDQPHLVIAHSHAGNITSYACRNDEVRAQVVGAVTMATPFIVARRRWGAIGFVSTLFMAFAIYIGLFVNTLLPTEYSLQARALAIAPCMVVLAVIAEFFSRYWIGFSERLLPQLQHALPDNSLIIRAIADETSRGIAFTQVPSMATSLLIRLTSKIIGLVSDRIDRMVWRHPIVTAVLAMALLFAFMLPVLFFVERASWPITLFVMALGLVLFEMVVMVVALIRHVPIMGGVFQVPVIVLIAPLIVLVTLFSAIFGPRFAIANFFLDVSVETTPAGRHTVMLIDDLPTRGGSALQHSSIYENESAIDAIEEYVGEILRQLE